MSLLFFLTFIYFNLSFYIFPSEFNLIKYILIFVLFVFIIRDYRILFSKNYKVLNILLCIFIFFILFSSFLCSLDTGLRKLIPLISPNIGISFSAIVFLSFFFIEIIYYKGYIKPFIKYLFRIITLYVIIVDLYVFTHLSTPELETSAIYLIGDKFQVVYLHLMWCSIYVYRSILLSKRKRTNLKLYIFLFISLIVSRSVYCSTGVIGVIIFFLFFLFQTLLKRFIYNPQLITLLILVSSFFVFTVEKILEIPIVQHIIEDVLHEDLTLTGRTVIYSYLAVLISEKPFFGYGYGNSSFIVSHAVGFGNAQNAVLDSLVNYGLVGFISLIIILYYIIYKYCTSSASFVFLVLLYIYAIMGLVEITMGQCFVLLLPLLLLTQKQKLYGKTSFSSNPNIRC